MLVMGGIVGSGIFINPYVVAEEVHTPFLILAAWALGGVVALAGAFVYAELAARRPEVGGQYAYLRDAFHPAVAFVYGWTLLLVTQTGGMAAVAVTFARYFLEITRAPVSDAWIAVAALALLTIVNCLGVRSGSNVQSALMLLKIVAIAALVGVGAMYVSVTFVCVRVLGAAGLAETHTPASAVMRAALGETGAKFIALGIAISTLGCLSQGMVTAPRVYFAMAEDGLFFRSVAWIQPRTAAPVVAIVLQGAVAVIITLSGRYEQILNYVVSVDFILFGMTGIALLILRRREPESIGFRAPGHPFTTLFFITASFAVVLSTIAKYPAN